MKEWTWVLRFHTSGLPCDDCEDELLHLVAFQQQHPRLLHVSPHVLINSNLYRCEFVEVPVAPGPPGPQVLGAHVPRSVPHDEASILHPRRDEPFSLVLDQGRDPCDGEEGVLGVGHGPVAESKLNPHRLAPVDLELEFEFLNKPDININYNYPCCYKLWIMAILILLSSLDNIKSMDYASSTYSLLTQQKAILQIFQYFVLRYLTWSCILPNQV